MTEWESGTPIYQQLADLLRARIGSGDLQPGDEFPAARALMADFKVASSTAQKAIRTLTAAGLVEQFPGRQGLRVRDASRIISRSGDYVSPVLEGQKIPHGPTTSVIVSEVVPPAEVAQLLGLNADEPVVRRARNTKKDGQVVQLTASYIPKAIADGTPLATATKVQGAMPTELKRLGYPPRSPAIEWVDTRMPTAEEARLLAMPSGAPVFHILRLTRTDGDRPIEVTEMVLPGHKYRMEYHLPIHE